MWKTFTQAAFNRGKNSEPRPAPVQNQGQLYNYIQSQIRTRDSIKSVVRSIVLRGEQHGGEDLMIYTLYMYYYIPSIWYVFYIYYIQTFCGSHNLKGLLFNWWYQKERNKIIRNRLYNYEAVMQCCILLLHFISLLLPRFCKIVATISLMNGSNSIRFLLFSRRLSFCFCELKSLRSWSSLPDFRSRIQQ